MKQLYTQSLRDENLRLHLEHGDTLIFTDAVKEWEAIERQVERLGFGEAYAVCRCSKPGLAGLQHDTRVTPLHMPARV